MLTHKNKTLNSKGSRANLNGAVKDMTELENAYFRSIYGERMNGYWQPHNQDRTLLLDGNETITYLDIEDNAIRDMEAHRYSEEILEAVGEKFGISESNLNTMLQYEAYTLMVNVSIQPIIDIDGNVINFNCHASTTPEGSWQWYQRGGWCR